MSLKPVTPKTLESLHNWFKHLTTYDDNESALDRLYAEGQIFACREALNDFDTVFLDIQRGFKPNTDIWFLKGYNAFRKEYNTIHVEYNI
jgi:hypothetical protein